MKTISKIFVLVLFVSMAMIEYSCNKQLLPTGENKVAVTGGNIWYKISGEGNGTPVVLLHGGPGQSSFGLKPFEELGDDRQVIRYDQLGGGKSDKISDTTLFTIDHFVEELEMLRKHLKITKWNVFGHSWGTIIAIEYYKKYPDKVISIIFGSACINMNLWEEHTKQLVQTLPESFKQAIANAESTGNFDDPLYQNAIQKFNSIYVCRHPVKADLDSLIVTMNDNIYVYMQGPSEFTITGTLKNYDATSFLPKIKVPTLFTVGEFDEAGPEIIKGFANKVPGSRYVVFPGSAHVTMWDARDENVKGVSDFLNSVDKK